MTTPIECADGVAHAISTFGTRFMLDPAFYVPPVEYGYSGLDFYVVGRGGVMGDVDADVVAAAFGFLEPTAVRLLWDAGRAVAPLGEAVAMFTAGAAEWGRAHFVADVDYDELARLCRAVADAAPIAGLPLFAGWRAVAGPGDGRGAAAVAMNILRELRGGAHLIAVVAAGLRPVEAVLHTGGEGSATMLGHRPPFPNHSGVGPTMAAVEEVTSRIVAPAFEALDSTERARLVELVAAATHEPT